MVSSIVITGGAGFIGSHTVNKLIKNNLFDRIIVLDNLYSGSASNINNLDRVDFYKVDISSYEDIYKIIQHESKIGDIYGIIHLAAIISVDEVYKNPLHAFETNVLGTLNLLEVSKEFNIPKFIYASSVAVYGEPIKIPISEDHPLKPKNLYGLTKLQSEELIRFYGDEYGLETVILRYFNVYGPKMRGGAYAGVIYKFINALLSDNKPIIYGDGLQTRDFIYIDDVVSANSMALKNGISGIFNIGSGIEISIISLLRKISDILGIKDLKPIRKPPRRGDVRRSKADISKAYKVFRWKPNISLEEGLKRTVKWFVEGKIFREMI